MPGEVVLECKSGPLAGRRFSFQSREICVVGRSRDCGLRIPDDENAVHTSRHHCILDINPPFVYVRDFGSMNGTYVNGARLETKLAEARSRELRDGDELVVGQTRFEIRVRKAANCSMCGAEIGEAPYDQGSKLLCDACIHVAETGRGVWVDNANDPSRSASALRAASSRIDATKENPGSDNAAANRTRQIADALGFELLGVVGRGGMGVVYKARKRGERQIVALKTILPEVAIEPTMVQLFLREAETTFALNHSNIVRLIDVQTVDAEILLALEFCEGGTVAQLIDTHRGKLALPRALEIADQVLKAISYAHKVRISSTLAQPDRRAMVSGIVHRDIKPANLLLEGTDDDASVKLSDFGLAKAYDLAGLSGLTKTGFVGGTPQFAPRQLVINFRHARPAVDIWSAAATLYTMLTGAHPRDFQKDHDPWHTVLRSKPVPIRKRDASIPEAVAKVVDYALTDDPEIPYDNADDLRRELREASRL